MWADESSSELRAGEFVEKRLEDFYAACETNHGWPDAQHCHSQNMRLTTFACNAALGKVTFVTFIPSPMNQSKEQPSSLQWQRGEKSARSQNMPWRDSKNACTRGSLVQGCSRWHCYRSDDSIPISLMITSLFCMAWRTGDMIESINEGTFFLVLDSLTQTFGRPIWADGKRNKIDPFYSPSRTRELTSWSVSVMQPLGVAKGMEYLHSLNIIFR
jgi:hypothetical protein